MRNRGIIAYGTDQDRERLEALAKAAGMTRSEWIIHMIRTQYAEKIRNG